mmetsp:Transcript_2335/g.6038  ORF Transcript_2335/g.6038 Transcript_2335/m.6038 type:complete len:299 (-) Transcript_2335:29-925(-)
MTAMTVAPLADTSDEELVFDEQRRNASKNAALLTSMAVIWPEKLKLSLGADTEKEEDETTDAGSDQHELSEVGSSSEMGSRSSSKGGTAGGVSSRLRSKFRGTPLEPIPGTPANRDDFERAPGMPLKTKVDARSSPGVPRRTASALRQQPRIPPPPAYCAPAALPASKPVPAPARGPKVLVPGPVRSSAPFSSDPVSPKRRKREATLAKARKDGVPLKIGIPEHLAAIFAGVASPLTDPSAVAKTTPPYPEFTGRTAEHLALGMEEKLPAKKNLIPWLTEDPPRLLPVPLAPARVAAR